MVTRQSDIDPQPQEPFSSDRTTGLRETLVRKASRSFMIKLGLSFLRRSPGGQPDSDEDEEEEPEENDDEEDVDADE